MSNPKDEMSRFVTGVADLVKEQCPTDMVHNDMNLIGLRCMRNPLKSPYLVRSQGI